MDRARTAVFIEPAQWGVRPGGLLGSGFTAARTIGKDDHPEAGFGDIPHRFLKTDHPGKALRALLIENQREGHDVWVFYTDRAPRNAASCPMPFRASLASIVGVRDESHSPPLIAPYEPRDLTLLPWEALRFVDFEKLEWNPREDYLQTYADWINRRGYSPYLLSVPDDDSPHANFADFLIDSGVLEKETRPFHQCKILAEIKRQPIPRDRSLSLLVDLSHFRNGYNGTMEYGRNLFQGMLAELGSSPFSRLEAVGEARHLEFHGISREHLIDPTDRTIFDVCFRPYQLDDSRSFSHLVLRARRYVISQLDAIGSRCDYIYESGMRFVQRLGLEAADGVVFISEYGLRDALEFFDAAPGKKPLRAILLGMEEATPIGGKGPSGRSSILVVGSWRYDHKMLHPVLDAVRKLSAAGGLDVHFHFLADLSGEASLPACVRYHTHDQTPAELDRLFASVDGFIFPSVYEGFGLPIAHAFRFGKPLLAADSEVNREIVTAYGGSGVTFFDQEADLADEILRFIDAPPEGNRPANPRDWRQVARETLEFLAECARAVPADSETRRLAREALLMHECRSGRLPDKAVVGKASTSAPGGGAGQSQPPLQAIRPTTKTILPRSLADTWIRSQDRLPAPVVRILRAIRKRLPEGK